MTDTLFIYDHKKDSLGSILSDSHLVFRSLLYLSIYLSIFRLLTLSVYFSLFPSLSPGSLSENLLEALREHPSVATTIEEIREQTTSEKKRRAKRAREEQLRQLGMKTNNKGQVGMGQIAQIRVTQTISLEDGPLPTFRLYASPPPLFLGPGQARPPVDVRRSDGRVRSDLLHLSRGIQVPPEQSPRHLHLFQARQLGRDGGEEPEDAGLLDRLPLQRRPRRLPQQRRQDAARQGRVGIRRPAKRQHPVCWEPLSLSVHS